MILEIKNCLTFSYQIGFNYNKIDEVIFYSIEILRDLIIVEKNSNGKINKYNKFLNYRNKDNQV